MILGFVKRVRDVWRRRLFILVFHRMFVSEAPKAEILKAAISVHMDFQVDGREGSSPCTFWKAMRKILGGGVREGRSPQAE